MDEEMYLRLGSMQDADLIFVGSVNKDRIHRDQGLTEAMVASSMRPNIGGSAAITALAATALGMKAGIVSAVGIENEALLRKIRERGVSGFFLYDPEKMTPESAIIVDAQGNKKVINNNSLDEAARLSPDDLFYSERYFNSASVVCISSYPSNPELMGHPTGDFLQRAREHNVTTMFDMSEPSSRWTEEARLDDLRRVVLPQVDFLCANEKELYFLGRSPEDKQFDLHELTEVEVYMQRDRVFSFAERMLELGVKLVNVHYGSKGGILYGHNGYVHLMPPFSEGEVQPVGAGNAHNAGALRLIPLGTGLETLGRADLEEIIRFANATAHLRITRESSADEFPSYARVREFLPGYTNHVKVSEDRKQEEPRPQLRLVEDMA